VYQNCPEDSLRLLASDDEFALAKLLESFGPTLEKAVSVHEPFMLVRLITNLLESSTNITTTSPSSRPQIPICGRLAWRWSTRSASGSGPVWIFWVFQPLNGCKRP